MKTRAILIFLALGIIIAFCLRTLDNSERTIVNYISIYGTYFTIYGFIITVIQIWHIKSISEATQISVNEAQARMKYILSVADFSKSIKTIQEIQGYIGNNKIESAVLRLSEIKEILVNIKQNPDFKTFADVDRCQELISQTGINLQNLRDYLLIKKPFNASYLGAELEQLSTLFIEIETSLKNKSL